MKTLLRAGFVALIVLGLASQAIRAGRGEDDGTEPTRALADGLARLGMTTEPVPGTVPLLAAQSPRCEETLLTGLLRIDGSQDGIARTLDRPNIEVYYIYLGTAGQRPSRLWLFARSTWATLLFQAGLRPTKPSSYMTVVAFPRSCTGLEATDWAALSPWN